MMLNIIFVFDNLALCSELTPVSTMQVIEHLSKADKVIPGMHDTLGGEQSDGFKIINKLCGSNPGLWSGDFGYSTHPNDSIRLRPILIEKIRKLHSEGVLITLSWHQCNPTMEEPCTFKDGVQRLLSEEEWQELLTEGSPLNIRWKKQMDLFAEYLKYFQDAGIPILLRPYHEANIPGFWWNNADQDRPKNLWRQLRSYFVDHHGLKNLIWVWSVSYHPKYWDRVAEYYPGNDVVDIVGLDIYPPTKGGVPDFEGAWNVLKNIAPKKPLVLSEVSRLPSMRELKTRKWAYVVPWGKNMLFENNSVGDICSIYSR